MATNAQFPFQHVGFSFEKNFNIQSWHEFFKVYWTYSIYISLIYLVIIFGLVKFMKGRPALNLRWPHLLWCLVLCLLNGYCTYRQWQDYFLYRSLQLTGSLVCQDYSCNTGVYGLAMVVFCFIKLLIMVELLLLVLNKHHLSFALLYHHVMTLTLTWYCAANLESVGQYFTIINCTFNAVLYGYRCFKATRLVCIPRFVRAAVNLAILVDLFILFFVNYLAYHYQSGGEFAGKSAFIQQGMMLVMSSYIVLFVHLTFFK